jgi:signal transduction histidine kinase
MSDPYRYRDAEKQALYRIASISAHEDNVAAVITEILRAIPEVVPCDRPVMFLYDDDTSEMRCFVGKGEEQPRLSLREPGIIRRIHHGGHGEIVNDVVADPDSSPAQGELYETRQLLAAPMIVGEHRVGVIAAVDSPTGAFTETDLDLLSVLADRAAADIHSAYRQADLDRQSRELEGLQRVARLLTSTDTLEHVIGEAVRIVTDLIECQRVMILLHDEDSDSLRIQPPAFGVDEADISELEIPLGHPSLASTVFRTSTPLVSNDARGDGWIIPELREQLGIENVLVVPLTSGHQPLGVLACINSSKGQFDEEDLRFTSLLGHRVGSVIELSRARDRERALMHRLREADRTKTEFVSILAHELKGPMTTIVGFGQMLQDHWATMEDDKRTQFIGIVRRETQRLANMVSDLLDVSRMESGNLRYEFEPMSLSDLIDNVVTVHASIATKHELEVHVEPDLPKVVGDKERLRQVVINLLTNATRYSPEGTAIRLRTEADPEDPRTIKVSVADEGIGIAPDDIERIFSKFTMLAKPAWTKKGTGLGLFITKAIVDAHKGRLWVESKLGEGSTFIFTVPAVSDEI